MALAAFPAFGAPSSLLAAPSALCLTGKGVCRFFVATAPAGGRFWHRVLETACRRYRLDSVAVDGGTTKKDDEGWRACCGGKEKSISLASLLTT